MQRFFPLLLITLLAGLFCSPTIIAQNTAWLIPPLKITKNDAQGKETTCSIQDAIKLVRLIMTQEGVERCETDLQNQLLYLVARPGSHPIEILLNSDLQKKMADIGFKVESNTLQSLSANWADGKNSKNKTTATTQAKTAKPQTKPDCDNCGEQKVKDDIKSSVLQNANYGGEILIDLPMGNLGGDMGNEQDYFSDEEPTEPQGKDTYSTNATKTSINPMPEKTNTPLTNPNPTFDNTKWHTEATPQPSNTNVMNKHGIIIIDDMPPPATKPVIVTQPDVIDRTHGSPTTTQPISIQQPSVPPANKTTPPTVKKTTIQPTKPAPAKQPTIKEKESQLDSLRRVLFKRPR